MSLRMIHWPQVAEQLARQFPKMKLHEAVLDWVRTNPSRGTWTVAFSGGADSLALLLLLWAHWPARRRQLRALHFNHRLRGRASATDETFCERVCRGLDVPLVAGRWEGAHQQASEAEARQARFEFFLKTLRPFRTKVLWFGHQQDDIAETLLMRLARGSGTGGLSAPRPVQKMGHGRVHLRPLLALKKEDITTALRQGGAAWREDTSNARDNYFRNRIRLTVLPAWQQASGERDVLGGAALTRELLEEDDVALETWVDELQLNMPDGSLKLFPLAGKPRAVTRRALHRWLLARRNPVDISRQAFNTLLRSIEKGGAARHSLGAKGFAVIQLGRLKFEPVSSPRSK